MPFSVNTRGVSEDGNMVAPAGTYLWNIAKARETASKDEGKPMLALELKLKCDQNGDTQFAGTTAFDYLVLEGKPLARAKMLYLQLGLPWEDGQMEFSYMDVAGMDVWAVCVEDSYEGRAQNKIAFDGYHRKNVPESAASAANKAAGGFGEPVTARRDELPI